MDNDDKEVVLDVRPIEIRLKHPTIFQNFDNLKEGETLKIINDHDPKPLHYQLLAERGETFDWTYEEKGPEVWIVKIKKKLNKGAKDEFDHKTVGEIVAEDARKMDIFKKYDIDFCCLGYKSLKDASMEAGIDLETLKGELKSINIEDNFKESLRYNEWDVDFLIDYIINNHHNYIKRHIAEITEYLEKITGIHKNNHPELETVNKLFIKLSNALLVHLEKEEKEMFIHMKDLAHIKENKENGLTQKDISKLMKITLKEISDAEDEHNYVGNLMKQIDSLTGHYNIPNDACASYSYTYKNLKEFFDDLKTHVHLENNILFKKVRKLAAEFI